jgi:fibronectin type 3 domain-containing protein
MRSDRLIASLLVSAAMASTAGKAAAQSCVSNVPHVTGEWRTLPYQMPINPISATLLWDGKVLIVAGSENDANNNSEGAESYRAAVWDPAGTTLSSIVVQNLVYDVFCSGTAALPDGRQLVVGGTSDYAFTGDKRSSIFDPVTGRFAQTQNMFEGRWYATATTLGDGRIMAFSGINLSGGRNQIVEIYDLKNAGNGWSTSASAPFSPPLYPRLFLLPSGKVFYTGQGDTQGANAWFFDPVNGTWTISVPTTRSHHYGSAVLLPLLPPNYTPRVMNFGGGNPATSTTEIIDLSAASPNWTPGPSMSTGRIQMNAVILPNGKVLAEGGSVNNEAPDTPGKRADLYDPVTNTMTSAGSAAYSRLYHSDGLLLPDATVVSMGSNPGDRGRYEATMEIYTPPYLFDANDQPITNRPQITAVDSEVIGYNEGFSVSYTSAFPISSAVLVRPGSSTHAFDMDQRLIGLCGASPQPACTGQGTLALTSPPHGNIAPPGYYMLFLLDSRGVPSIARFIQLSPYALPPPTGAIASPASDVTIPAGGSVNFSTNTSAAKYSWVFPGGNPAKSSAQNPGNVTFSVPGTYVVSLTVIDSTGDSDPSPPTRTINVLPPAPDFSIEVGPSGQEVSPGDSTTFTVKVTPLSGFTGAVSLSVSSESGFLTGVTSGGFAPATINGSGTSVLTMNTSTSAVPYALSLTITGTSGTLAHTASTTLLVNLAPPASLTANPGSGQVSLSWASSVGATGYHVKRAIDQGGPYVVIACPTGTSYTDTAVVNGTTYYYVVSASYTGGPNAGGESTDSSEASATPTPATALPPAPTGLTATPGDAQVTLDWSASSGATSYHVMRSTVSGGPYTTVGSPTSTSYVDTGLTNGTTYYYVVSALNFGGESGNSGQVAAMPKATVAAPPAPTGLVAWPGDAKVGLTWNASAGATSYRVKRSTVNGGPYTVLSTVTTTSYASGGLTNGTTYYYVVSALNSGGESPNSTQVAATPQAPPPPAPTGLAATPGDGQVALTWTASAGATSYRVKRSTVNGGPYTTVGSPTATSYTDPGLTNGTTYYYVVSAVNSAGESPNSAQATAMPKAAVTPPAAPTGVAATPGDAQVALTWTASSGATSYNVKRSTVNGGPYTTVGNPTSTSFTDLGLTNGTTYYYVVSALNSGGESANSAQVAAMPKATVLPPAAPTGLAGAAGDGQVALTWNASSGATSYRVKRSTVNGGPYTTVGSPTSTSYTDAGLTNGTTYYYVVSALNSGGESPNSAQAAVMPQAPSAPPAAPTNLTAAQSRPRTISLLWTEPAGATANRIYRRLSGGVYPATPMATIGATSAYQDSGLAKHTTYCYMVTAANGAGESPRSNEACATTK